MRKRREAFLVKNVDPIFSIVMNIMPHRYDATNYTILPIACEGMDKYIQEKRAEGKRYSYMHIMIAAIVRCFAMRPELNRFTMNARLYEQYKITVAFMVKRTLRDEAEELLVKYAFNGNETLPQIAEILDREVERIKKENVNSDTSKTAGAVAGLPMWLSKAVVNYLRWSDKRNCMPKIFYDVSPFHNSFFLTNLKSIKTDSIVHHCYDFGTTSMFIAMGKEKMEAVVDDEHNIVPAKIMQLGVSSDERICDGLYFGKSLHLCRTLLADPTLLETEYHDAKIDAEIEKDRLAKQLAEEKEAKKAAKLAKRSKK